MPSTAFYIDAVITIKIAEIPILLSQRFFQIPSFSNSIPFSIKIRNFLLNNAYATNTSKHIPEVKWVNSNWKCENEIFSDQVHTANRDFFVQVFEIFIVRSVFVTLWQSLLLFMKISPNHHCLHKGTSLSV